jgi:hypothetical protein
MTAGRWFFPLVLVVLVFVSAPAVYGRAKTDVLVLNNGDTITGEIKYLDKGKLSLSTAAMSTVSIEWNDIVSLSSQYYFEMEDQDSYKYFGTPKLENGVFRVFLPASVVTFDKEQIVKITPIEDSVRHRLHGSVSLGTSFTKGTRVGKLDFSGDLKYRAEHDFFELKAATNYTSQQDLAPTSRSDASLTYQRLYKRKLFWNNSVSAFQSDEQGVALRTTLATGPGVNLIQSNSHLMVSSLGLSVNREWATADSVNAVNNFEGVLSADYSIFKYDTPKTDLGTTVAVYPALPDFDRLRMDFQIQLRQELITDFFLDLTFWDNFDSRPPSEGALKNDYGIVTSFGYTF